MDNDYGEKTIAELKGYKFEIPSYQRGYRWTQTEVKALLDDIDEFNTENETKKYCIQPLIVKKIENNKYEVVDGQQRLTTIYLCLKALSKYYSLVDIPYELEYKTSGREKSKEFLIKISNESYDDSNIDYYYMSEAYKVINDWIKEKPDLLSIVSKMTEKIRKSIFFIWYEIPQSVDSIDIFTKVNLGKIKLTNSELIKAMLLSKDNYKDENFEKIYKQQLEISLEWDRIEQKLQNNSFWYFLSSKESSGPRIDLLFDLLADQYNEFGIVKEDEEYYSFLVFLEKFKRCEENKNKLAFDIWEDIKKIYEEFCEWYDNLDKYHIIGFLTSIGISIKDIYDISTQNVKKSEKNKMFIDMIKKDRSIKKVYDTNTAIDLYYPKDNIHIRKILLFFNIATLYCKGEKQYRFPFDIYHKEHWDIEHIHATNAKDTEDDEADSNIENLTLLDYKTNREYDYRNSPFDVKRKIILEKDSNGKFVPICTKNVFLKVYSSGEINDSWNEIDKSDYSKAIVEIIKEFFKKGENQNGD